MRPALRLVVAAAGLGALVSAPSVRAQTAPAPAQTAAMPAATPQELFKNDVHAKAGLTCATCHAEAAPAAVERTKIVPLCTRCHADPAYMHQFNPKVKTDQLALYLTSKHGQQNAKGETRTATCADCHRSHGVLPASDPNSTMAPANVVNTCAKCHSDEERMKVFEHFGDPPADWKGSVHADALLKRGDTSAPTCTTCHSAHGPAPAGVTAMPLVCAECHAREADLFAKSPHKKGFEQMEQPGCITCHSNHEIKTPSAEFIGMDDPGLCGTCHGDPKTPGKATVADIRQRIDKLGLAVDQARAVLDRAAVAGMLVDDGQAALRVAVQQQILARVAVHTVVSKAVAEPTDKGLAAAAGAEKIGWQALADLQTRRRGLAVATLLIVGFLITLAIKIRQLPPPEA